LKIPLNMGETNDATGKRQLASIERLILAAKGGDWNARHQLARRFNGLLTSLAQKRATDPRDVQALIEAGKRGLNKAAKKYRPSIKPEKFQIFALDYIEREMNAAAGGRGFLARLFGR